MRSLILHSLLSTSSVAVHLSQVCAVSADVASVNECCLNTAATDWGLGLPDERSQTLYQQLTVLGWLELREVLRRVVCRVTQHTHGSLSGVQRLRIVRMSPIKVCFTPERLIDLQCCLILPWIVASDSLF